MLLINDLYKSLNKQPVLKGINLKADKGSIYGLIGPNRSGKTTLIKTILGIYTADKGSILFNDELLIDSSPHKQRVAYVPDYSIYYPHYKIKDLIDLYQRTYKFWDEQRYAKLRVEFNLDPKQKVKNLSKGMKTRLSLLLNLALQPQLLLLDEPTSGLDPIIRDRVLKILKQEAEQNSTTMIISNHNLAELEQVCDHIGIIRDGVITQQSSLKQLKSDITKVQVYYDKEFPLELQNHPDILNINRVGKVHYLTVAKNTEQVLKLAQHHNPVLLEKIDVSLNEIFTHKVEGK